jgi:hypothetical protein
LEGLGMENVGPFYGHLEYIWYIKGPFGNLVVSWYSFPRFGILYQEKSGNHVTRVARWFIFKPNPPISVYYGRPWNLIFSYIL